MSSKVVESATTFALVAVLSISAASSFENALSKSESQLRGAVLDRITSETCRLLSGHEGNWSVIVHFEPSPIPVNLTLSGDILTLAWLERTRSCQIKGVRGNFAVVLGETVIFSSVGNLLEAEPVG